MTSQSGSFSHYLNFLTCLTGKTSHLAGLLEDQIRSYINKSIVHSIIDSIIVTPATEPDQRMFTGVRGSEPGTQWLPCGCSLDFQKKNGDCGNNSSPIHRF